MVLLSLVCTVFNRSCMVISCEACLVANNSSSSSHDQINKCKVLESQKYTLVVNVKTFWRTDKVFIAVQNDETVGLLWRSLVERSMPGQRRLEMHRQPVSHDVSPGRLT